MNAPTAKGNAAKSLSYKQRTFIEHFLQTWNASAAARKANYANAWQAGSRLLRNVEVQKEIERRLNEMELTANEVLARLSEQARANISDFVRIVSGADGAFQIVEIDWEMLKAKGYLVKSITSTKYGPRLELYDGQAALIQIGRHHALFTDRQESAVVNAAVNIYLPDNGRNDR